MYAPRALFSGRNAVEACFDPWAFKQAIILHTFSLGLDASPEQIDALLQNVDADDEQIDAPAVLAIRAPAPGQRRLFTAFISETGSCGTLQAFLALIAEDATEIQKRLRDRYGARLAGTASVQQGFDASAPIAIALVSEAMADTLALIQADPESRLAEGLDIQIESRFSS